MNIYLDEDIAQPLLAKLLRGDGHNVLSPGESGLRGKPDPVQFAYAIRTRRVLMTGNHRDFEDLHDLVPLAGGHHSGILTIRRDNDPTRDISVRGIVRAVAKVNANLQALTDLFQALNQWR